MGLGGSLLKIGSALGKELLTHAKGHAKFGGQYYRRTVAELKKESARLERLPDTSENREKRAAVSGALSARKRTVAEQREYLTTGNRGTVSALGGIIKSKQKHEPVVEAAKELLADMAKTGDMAAGAAEKLLKKEGYW